MFGAVAHRIQRNQNHKTSVDFRLADRSTPLTNTLSVLEDPKNQRRLFLIGSTHSSTLLALRTKELIQQLKPDSVYVQTNEKWWNIAKQIENVDNQAELNKYHRFFEPAFEFKLENGTRNFRNTVFWLRLYFWLFQMNWIRQLGREFNWLTPGLEVKYAIQEALNHNSKVYFGGLGLNNSDLQALKVDTRMDPISVFRNYVKVNHMIRWSREKDDLIKLYNTLGGEAFAESFDKYRANWFVQYFEKVSPHQKRILVDIKEETIFKTLYREMPGKNIVAVVNQWHMDGIEKHWRQATGTVQLDPINPIGDMDLEAYFEENLVNDFLRTYVSRLTKSEPATSRNHLTQYFKECQEQERVRHVEFFSHDDHHMYHGLPYEGGYQHHHDRLPQEQQPKLDQNKHHH